MRVSKTCLKAWILVMTVIASMFWILWFQTRGHHYCPESDQILCSPNIECTNCTVNQCFGPQTNQCVESIVPGSNRLIGAVVFTLVAWILACLLYCRT